MGSASCAQVSDMSIGGYHDNTDKRYTKNQCSNVHFLIELQTNDTYPVVY